MTEENTAGDTGDNDSSSLPEGVGPHPVRRDLIEDLSPRADAEVGSPSPPLTLIHCLKEVFYDHDDEEADSWTTLGEMTFHGRHESKQTLRRTLIRAKHTPENILVVGDSGHGKSTLIRKVTHDLEREFSPDWHPLCRTLNLRALGPNLVDATVFPVINAKLKSLLQHLGHAPPPGIDAQLASNVGYGRLCTAIENVDISAIRKERRIAILVVDDVDYVEAGYHHKLLALLKPLMLSPNVTVVWACRPPALKEVDNAFRYASKNTFVHIDPIELTPPDIEEIILGRIWPFIDTKYCPPHVRDIIEVISQKPQYARFPAWILAAANKAAEKVKPIFSSAPKKIPYPFSDWEDFLSRVSNGDIRIVFGMVARLFDQVEEHLASLKPHLDAEGKRIGVRIGRDRFYSTLGLGCGLRNPILPEEEGELWRILDLFERTNSSGRSPLYVNTLQWMVVGARRMDSEYLEAMEAMGFSRMDAREAFDYCRHARLIEPEVIRTGAYRIGLPSGRGTWRWFLTRKGSYYLRTLIGIPEYRKAYCGLFPHYECFFSLPEKNSLHYDATDLLAHLVAADAAIRHVVEQKFPKFAFTGDPGYLRLPKSFVSTLFLSIYGPRYRVEVEHKWRGVTECREVLAKAAIEETIYSLTTKEDGGEGLVKSVKDEDTMFGLKRMAIREAAKRRRLVVPNNAGIDAALYLPSVHNLAWSARLDEHTDGECAHEALIEAGLRVLQEQGELSFKLEDTMPPTLP